MIYLESEKIIKYNRSLAKKARLFFKVINYMLGHIHKKERGGNECN